MQAEKTDSKNLFSPKESLRTEDSYQEHYIQFIEMAAHDLQAPIRKLGVLTDLLINKIRALKDEEAEKYILRIHSSIDTMRSLIESFTELSKAIPETMVYETCNLEQIIKMILQESSAEVKLKEANISIGQLPVIQADKAQLRVLFKNLLENSFRFSKPGTPLKIAIQAETLTDGEKEDYQLDEKKTYCKISLQDNGIGFEDEDNEKVFQPMVRLHGKSEYPGNGLGLAIVKRIIDNHNGIVYAVGNGEKGARIILIIPENHD